MRISIFALVILSVLLSWTGIQAQPKTLTILHTNDIHSGFLPREATWARTDPKPIIGGFEELWWIADSLRKAKPDNLFLDAGDVMTGTPISDMVHRGAYGGGLFEMMNLLEYDAWTFGNHDLDISQSNLIALTRIAKFPTLSSNMVDTAGRFPLNNIRYLILDRGGLRVGIIGIMTKELFSLTNTNNLKGLRVLPPIATIQPIIDELDPKTDLIIALTHQGVDEDSILAMGTRGIDIIIGGHSHTRLNRPKTVNGVIIGQAGANCEQVGELEVTVENDSVIKHNGKLHQLWKRDRPSSEMGKMAAKFKDEVQEKFSEVLGSVASDLKRARSVETAIGNFVTEAILTGSGAQIAVTNTSGIRKDINAGKITRLDLYELSPFRNYVSIATVSGKELRELVSRYVRASDAGEASIQIAGIECIWSRVDGAVHLEMLKVEGKDVKDEAKYTLGTSDFLINQADKYLGFVPSTVVQSEKTIFDALVAKLRKDKTIRTELTNKIRERK